MTTSRSEKSSAWTSFRTILVWVLSCSAVLLAVRLGLAYSFDSGPFPPALSKITDLPITLANGQPARLGNLIRLGRPTVISIWASWCGPCRSEAPALADLRQQYGKERINFLYLNAREEGASRDELDAFVSSVGMPGGGYAVLDSRSLSILTNDNRNLIPRTYVFDRSGSPIAVIVGYKPLALQRVEGLLHR